MLKANAFDALEVAVYRSSSFTCWLATGDWPVTISLPPCTLASVMVMPGALATVGASRIRAPHATNPVKCFRTMLPCARQLLVTITQPLKQPTSIAVVLVFSTTMPTETLLGGPEKKWASPEPDRTVHRGETVAV